MLRFLFSCSLKKSPCPKIYFSLLSLLLYDERFFSKRNGQFIDDDVCLILSLSNNFRLGSVTVGWIELVQVSITSDIRVSLRCLTKIDSSDEQRSNRICYLSCCHVPKNGSSTNIVNPFVPVNCATMLAV